MNRLDRLGRRWRAARHDWLRRLPGETIAGSAARVTRRLVAVLARRLVQARARTAMLTLPDAIGTLPPDAPETLATLLATFQQRYGRLPGVLDTVTGGALARQLPLGCVVTRRLAPPPWPNAPQSHDVVAVPPGAIWRAEAQRVASAAVVVVDASHTALTWLHAACPRPLPSVSVIIPTYNTATITSDCLRQVLATWPEHVDGEVIVMDDASSDGTVERLDQAFGTDPRVRLLRNETNLRFLRSCQRASAAATGDVLLFLNSDTLPLAGWLGALLGTLSADASIGAVGGRLWYPDGRLQEAGGLIFADGSGWNVGKGAPLPAAPLFDFEREVDYCSGALLATWRDLFWQVGGFDEQFAPMYYEDVDYCFAVRRTGRRVVYQPRAEVVHLEGATAGTDVRGGPKTHQVTNRGVLRTKWAEALRRRPDAPSRYDERLLPALFDRAERACQADRQAGARRPGSRQDR